MGTSTAPWMTTLMEDMEVSEVGAFMEYLEVLVALEDLEVV